MVVIPGLTDSLGAVGKRITHFETTEGGLAVDIASTVRSAQCPKCSHRSSRRHGQYRRRLSAEPSMGRPVSLGVEMRRFKCVNRQCSQATFAEQIDALALPKQRRTVGLDGAWRSIAQALGGSAASRLATTLGMPTSRDTLLRRLRRLGSNATPPTPVVVGIDDWAITRGHRYGTIAVDLERRCPIEVLDGRESTSVADWLQRHPSIKVVARDRAGAYSEAVQKVIPHAHQVADRWHLLLRVVGRLPGARIRASIRHDLRAGVAQASREETAATATGGCSRHRSYGDLSAVLPAAKADDEVIRRSMTLPAISACTAQDVGAVVAWANSLSPARKTRVCPASAASVRVGNGFRCWHALVAMTAAVREWFDRA